MLMLSLRDKGTCPCPRCTILKPEISQLGTSRDRARREKQARSHDHLVQDEICRARELIYQRTGYAVNSQAVDNLLKSRSLVPTVASTLQNMYAVPNLQGGFQNTFSHRLAPFGVNHYRLFVVDLMHEVELGVWKAVFTHLIRILHVVGAQRVDELNHR
jgi:hypothetical protein